jgi:hypothetical protein
MAYCWAALRTLAILVGVLAGRMAGKFDAAASALLPTLMLMHFTAVGSQQDTSQLPCPAMPNGESATST